MRVVFHPEALFELEAAADFYAGRHKGLEVRFIDAVDSAIRRACMARIGGSREPGYWRSRIN